MSDQVKTDVAIVNLEELAELMGTSVNTVRALLRDHADFPVVARGSNGTPYQFDARAVRDFVDALAEAEAAAAAQRAADLKALRLDLFPGTDEADPTLLLTPAQRKTELEAIDKMDLIALRRGQLVRADDVANTLRAAFSAFRAQVVTLPDNLARELDLDRETRTGLRARLDAALATLAGTMRAEGLENDRAA